LQYIGGILRCIVFLFSIVALSFVSSAVALAAEPLSTIQSIAINMSTRCEDVDGLVPQIGFGTATLKEGDECSTSVSAALNAGVRLIDTALLYGNQITIGKVLSETTIPRKDIWITSKVGFFPSDNDVNIDPWMNDDTNRKGDEAASIELCLNQLGVEYIDLILLHSPWNMMRRDYLHWHNQMRQ